MKSIHFNDELDKLNSKDIISFMSYLVGKPEVKNCKVWVGRYKVNKGDMKLMCEVLIYFQTTKNKAKNKFYIFRNYRAINFSCQSMSCSKRVF